MPPTKTKKLKTWISDVQAVSPKADLPPGMDFNIPKKIIEQNQQYAMKAMQDASMGPVDEKPKKKKPIVGGYLTKK